MSVKVREQRGKLYLDIYQGGVRKWESLHITLSDDKKQNKELMRLAEVCRSKREAQLLSGEWDIKANNTHRITLVAYIKNYAKNHVNQNPIEALIRHIEKYTNGSTIKIVQVTSKWVEGFQENLIKSSKSNGKQLLQSSIAAYMGILRTVFRKAVADGIISRDPTEHVVLAKKCDADMVFLNTEEVKRLAAEIPETAYGKEVRRAFLFSCFTGLRISDIETLTWEMIEHEPPQIIKRQKKTRNPVYIPLNKNAQSLIFDDTPHDTAETVFNFSKHRRDTSYRILRKWAKGAGITKKIGWHTARRTFATLTLAYGANTVTVARLLGHTGLSQVMKYAKATDAMRRKAVESLPDLM